jgi:ubiquinol-cytochrome c reductase cytochrome b subunit
MSLRLADIAARQAQDIDTRYHPSAAVRRQLNKVFPTHWSFLLGEIALYSFVVLLITGVYLTLFFDPSMTEVTYNGVYRLRRRSVTSASATTKTGRSSRCKSRKFMKPLATTTAAMQIAIKDRTCGPAS